MADQSNSTVQTQLAAFFDDDIHRHWAPDSQTYAPADVLMNYLWHGWVIDPVIVAETFFYAGFRRVDTYYFTLRREDEVVEMPVLVNPAVHRLVSERKLNVQPATQGEDY